MGEWRHNSNILGLGNRWKYVISFTPPSLYPGGFALEIAYIDYFTTRLVTASSYSDITDPHNL
jgi:hypothetical protein